MAVHRTELPRDWPQLSTSCQTPRRAGLAIPVAGRGGDFEPIAASCRAAQKAAVGMIPAMVRVLRRLALTDIGELDLAG